MSNAAVINATNSSGWTVGSPITIETGGDVVLKAYGSGSGSWSVTLSFAPVVGGVTGSPTTLTIGPNAPSAKTSVTKSDATQWVGWVSQAEGTWEASGLVEGYTGDEALANDLGYFASSANLPTKALKLGAKATLPSGPVTWRGVSVGWRETSALNKKPLLPFWAKLKGANESRCSIMFFGNSITSGARCDDWKNHYANVLRGKLAREYPCIDGNPAGGKHYPAVQTSVNGPAIPKDNTAATVATANYGPGVAGFVVNSGYVTLTVTGTSVDVWLVKAPGARPFNVSVDGGTEYTITVPSAASAEDGYVVNIPLGASGVHTVKFVRTSANIYLTAFSVYDGDETRGIYSVIAGHSGWGIVDMLNGPTTYPGSSFNRCIASANPALIVMMWGANDWGKGVRTPAQFGADLAATVDSIIAARPGTPIAIAMDAYSVKQVGTVLAPYAQYVDQARNVANARTESVIFIDLPSVMPDGNASNSYGLFYTDNLHPSATGHRLIADVLFEALRIPDRLDLYNHA